MSHNKPRERLLFTCLLVALIVGVFALKLWVMTVEQRLAENLATHWISMDTDRSQTNVLTSHERRLRAVERTAWAVWDQHAPCDGWPTQREIARGE